MLCKYVYIYICWTKTEKQVNLEVVKDVIYIELHRYTVYDNKGKRRKRNPDSLLTGLNTFHCQEFTTEAASQTASTSVTSPRNNVKTAHHSNPPASGSAAPGVTSLESCHIPPAVGNVRKRLLLSLKRFTSSSSSAVGNSQTAVVRGCMGPAMRAHSKASPGNSEVAGRRNALKQIRSKPRKD